MKIKYIGGWRFNNLGDIAIKTGFKKLFWRCQITDDEAYPDMVALVGGTANPEWVRELRKYTDKGIPAISFGTGWVRGWVRPWKKNQQVNSRTAQEDWRAIAKKALFVGVRTPNAKRILGGYGIENIMVVGDPALVCGKPIKFVRKKVGLSIHASWGIRGSQSIVDQCLRELITYFSNMGYEIELFPCMRDDLLHNIDFIENIATVVSIHKDFENIEQTVDKISECSLLIGMRLHTLIIAAACGVPIISLAYHEKCDAFMESMGLEALNCRTDSLNIDKLILHIQTLKSRTHYYRKHLLETTARYVRSQKKIAGNILNLIKHAPDKQRSIIGHGL